MFYARHCNVETIVRGQYGTRIIMTYETDATEEDSVFDLSQYVQLDGGELSVDAIFGLLSSRRRRFVLYFLSDADGPVGSEELARRIATWEADSDIGDISSEEVGRVTVALNHAHLPRLEADGVVEYDRENRTVEATDAVEQLEPFLDIARAADFD